MHVITSEMKQRAFLEILKAFNKLGAVGETRRQLLTAVQNTIQVDDAMPGSLAALLAGREAEATED